MESEPTYYKNYSAPDNCRKYRFYFNSKITVLEVNRMEKAIQGAYADKNDYSAMCNCKYYFGEKGCITSLSDYLQALKQEQEQLKQIKAARETEFAA